VAELTQEQFDQLPDFVKGDYEKAGEVYIPVAEGKMRAMKGTLNDLDSKYKQANSELQAFKSQSQLAQEAAEAAALEKLKKEGKTDEIVSDLTRRHGETVKEFQARIEARDKRYISTERKSIISEVAKELKVFDDSLKLFAKMIEDRISIDPETEKRVFLDENGGATSLDLAGLIAELAKDPAFDRLRQANVSTGGLANGNNGGKSSGALNNPWSKSTFNLTEQARILQTNPALAQTLKSQAEA